jgi:hypothetical protein
MQEVYYTDIYGNQSGPLYYDTLNPVSDTDDGQWSKLKKTGSFKGFDGNYYTPRGWNGNEPVW